MINGRIVKGNIGECQVRDSYALLPAPLSAYKKDEIDYRIFEKKARAKPENMRKIRDYLKTDCVYLYDMVTDFIRTHGMALTQAGAAMKKWEEIDKEKAPQSTKKFFEFFSQFYFGGRVEVFRAGHIPGPHKLYDIKSAYPRAMLEKHPYKLGYTTLAKPDKSKIKPTSFVEVTCVSNGALPYRDGNKITFPCDNVPRRYYAIGHELINALALGLVRDCDFHAAHNFTIEKDFGEYIKPLYEVKLKADKVLKDIKDGIDRTSNADYWQRVRLFAKLLMNSLYGKFGANPENYGHYLLAPDEYEMTEFPGYEKYAELEKIDALMKPLDEREERYYNVATAASITSWVRSYLLKSIHRSSDVLYCDTDSLLCSEFYGEIGDDLGQWNHEADISESWIAGKKLYALKKTKRDKDGLYKLASKGVRLDASEIKKLCLGETVLYRPQSPTYSFKKEPGFIPRRVKMLDDVKAKIPLAGHI